MKVSITQSASECSIGKYTMMAKGALCLLVISLLLHSITGPETAPQNPFSGPINKACEGLTGVMQQTARTLCKQKDSLNIFSILLAKVLRGQDHYQTSTHSACQNLSAGENKEQCTSYMRLRNLYKGFKDILDGSGKVFTNRFPEDRFMLFDSTNLAIFLQGLDNLPPMESTSTVQMQHALVETGLENRAQLRLLRIQVLEFQQKFYGISLVGMGISLALVSSYLLIGGWYIYKYIIRCQAKREANEDNQEMERFSRLMRHYRLREQEEQAMIGHDQALLPIQ